MNKLKGRFFKGVGLFFDYFLGALIAILSFFVSVFATLRQGLFIFFAMGGCLLLFIFLITSMGSGKTGWWILLILIFPILGSFAVSRLKYAQYMITEYFYDKADFYLLGRRMSFDHLGDYGRRYERLLEQERLRREQEYQREREEEARRRFEEFARNFQGFTFTFYDGEGPQGWSTTGGPQGGGPFDVGFKETYENAAKVLGIPPESDIYEIKLAFRKLARKYHPDVSDAPDAKERFQEINDAYEFMEKNHQRYKG